MRVCVVGYGIVGKATAFALQMMGGHDVSVYDSDELKVTEEALHVEHESGAGLQGARFQRCATLVEAVKDFDAVVCCVPTPRLPNGLLDMKAVDDLFLTWVGNQRRTGGLFVQRSTSNVGYAQANADIMMTRKVGDDRTYLYCPSFLYRKTAIDCELNPPKILVGIHETMRYASVEYANALFPWSTAKEKIMIGRFHEVEVAKMASNNAQAVILAFLNELNVMGQSFGDGFDADWVMRTLVMEDSLSSLYRVFGKAWGADGRMEHDLGAWVTQMRNMVTMGQIESVSQPWVTAGALALNEQLRSAVGEERRPTDELKALRGTANESKTTAL